MNFKARKVKDLEEIALPSIDYQLEINSRGFQSVCNERTGNLEHICRYDLGNRVTCGIKFFLYKERLGGSNPGIKKYLRATTLSTTENRQVETTSKKDSVETCLQLFLLVFGFDIGCKFLDVVKNTFIEDSAFIAECQQLIDNYDRECFIAQLCTSKNDADRHYGRVYHENQSVAILHPVKLT